MATLMITGANRGIGFELTRCYAAAGNTVLACCREPAAAKDLSALAAANKSVKVLAVNVADPKSVASLKSTLGDEPIDVLINNAGVQGPQNQSLEQMDYEGWAQTFAVNSMAPLRMLQTFRGNLANGKQPKVVTITSQMGALSLDITMAYAYCASKAAVNKVMKLASVELAQQGIVVSLIHPGWVKTDMGGPHAPLTVEESAQGIQSVIDKLTPADNGSFKKWNGEPHGW